jgi:hypothetical protein
MRHEFAFAPSYRLPARLLGITPATSWVQLDEDAVTVRFGAWRLHSTWSNVVDVTITGGYSWWRTAGPPHLSFADRGVTFATNPDIGVCLRFARPVPAISPGPWPKHPGATVTVAQPEQLAAEVRRRAGITPQGT